jgi:chromosome partitioning protein
MHINRIRSSIVPYCGKTRTGSRARRRAASHPRKGCIQVLPARTIHELTFEHGDVGARYHTNVRRLLRGVAPFADVCLIDCPPLPDMRTVCVEATADALLSPIHRTHSRSGRFLRGCRGFGLVRRGRFNVTMPFRALRCNSCRSVE